MTLQTKLLAILLIFGALPFGTRYCASASEKSLSIGVGGITFHPLADDVAVEAFSKPQLGRGNTLHPGLYLKYRDGRFTQSGWVFRDSFGNIGGGGLVGVEYKILPYVSVGAAGGVYIRERVPKSVKDFPVSIKTDKVEITPIGGPSLAVEIPVNKSYGVETNCLLTVFANHCNIGLKIKW